LFGRKQELTVKKNGEAIDFEKTIEEIITDNEDARSRNIFELAYIRPKEQDLSKEQVKEVAKILDTYDSKYGILEKFDGAEDLVNACLKAVQNWSNKDLREAWDQWLKEVKSFISFPGFFARLTSDKKNSTLLFDILSSIPEQETKKAQEKHKKEVEK
jgi:hypothetical protein